MECRVGLSLAFLPRAIPHGFRVGGSRDARLLLITTPAAGLDGFVAEISEPKPPTAPPDLQRLVQIAATHGLDLLGPLPR